MEHIWDDFEPQIKWSNDNYREENKALDKPIQPLLSLTQPTPKSTQTRDNRVQIMVEQFQAIYMIGIR